MARRLYSLPGMARHIDTDGMLTIPASEIAHFARPSADGLDMLIDLSDLPDLDIEIAPRGTRTPGPRTVADVTRTVVL